MRITCRASSLCLAGLLPALALVPGHNFRFYCTTPQMAAQYKRLDVGDFLELPYAINPAFAATERTAAANRPLRVTCAGGQNDYFHLSLRDHGCRTGR